MMTAYSKGLLTALVLLAGGLYGQLSPGSLAAPHDHLSGMTSCLNCHTWGSKDLAPKCLDCHTPIQTRVESKKGFHGLMKNQVCVSCHQDHLGKTFGMIRWDPSRKDFDHSQTGYELSGQHQKLDCGDCHKPPLIKDEAILAYAKLVPAKKFLESTSLGLGTACADCHEDVHKGEFQEKGCQECHSTTDWKEAPRTFDHDVQTKYPLKGAHRDLTCEKCHKDQQEIVGKFQSHKFGGLKYEKCTDCHADEHKGGFSQNCLECHTIRSFKVSSKSGVFDHEASRFPLIGRHQQVKCAVCHTRKRQFKLVSSFNDCTDCHEDYHKGIFKQQNRDVECDRCHSERGFSPALFGMIEHQNTRLPLEGSHLAIPCLACHGTLDSQKYRWDRVACDVCHESVHGEQFQKYRSQENWCAACHSSTEWAELSFDHGRTKFPLSGKHLTAACDKCHKPVTKPVPFEGLDVACSSCHADVHASQFADRSCDYCHGTDTWSIAVFDHARLTRFALDGRHEKLLCGECHKFESELKTIRFKPIPSDCQDCHKFGVRAE